MTEALLELNTQTAGVPSGDEDLRQYIGEIRQYPLLTQEQELELAKACASGDEEAVRRMVNSNLRLVVAIAREYSGRGIPLLDLIQEGSIGLIIAARKFDYTLDFRFSTYATKWIRQRISRCIANHAALIRVPAHTSGMMRKLITARADFLAKEGREPAVSELSELTELPEGKVDQLLQLIPEVSSLDTPVGEDGENTVADLLPGDGACEPQAVLIREEMKAIIDALMAQLNERQQQIVRLRFGLDDGICHTLDKIGQIVGVSKERARQLEQQAIKRLNRLSAEYGLEEFLE